MKRSTKLVNSILNAIDYLTIECEKEYYTCVVVEFDEGDGLDWLTIKKGDNYWINSNRLYVEGQGAVELCYIYDAICVHNFNYTPEGYVKLGKTIKTF